MIPTTITPYPNGPLLVRGAFDLQDEVSVDRTDDDDVAFHAVSLSVPG